MEELCERAGVERESFEREYGDLEGAFLRSLETLMGRYHERTDPIRCGDGDWRDRVRLVGYELLRFFREDEKASYFLIVEVRTAGEKALRVFGAEVEILVQLMDEGRLQPGAPATLTRSTAEQIAGGFFNQLYAIFNSEDLPPEEEIIPQLMYTAVLPYLGEEAALEELSIPPPPNPSQG